MTRLRLPRLRLPAQLSFLKHPRTPLALGIGIPAVAIAVVAGLFATGVIVPNAAGLGKANSAAALQSFTVAEGATPAPVQREGYTAVSGIVTLSAAGTNYDWARMVLLLADLPMTESNVTVITRWMRQENYTDTWYNRNNPLNNGWGSGGGGGTGSYGSLVSAAENAAEALHSVAGYAGIVQAFAASASAEAIEQAIWASPWASGHYNNGAHWSYVPVPVITAPAGAW